ncbi:hypothetical protein MHBO_003492 [Bonamia ostreae]|uniref:Uncharacterized protein n=1 Tax=Bonamia ostreae TaxID=126728 RepID=A0ABV2ARI0_9EUKA
MKSRSKKIREPMVALSQSRILLIAVVMKLTKSFPVSNLDQHLNFQETVFRSYVTMRKKMMRTQVKLRVKMTQQVTKRDPLNPNVIMLSTQQLKTMIRKHPTYQQMKTLISKHPKHQKMEDVLIQCPAKL